ncbi:MAG: hypothetical protein Q8Q53_10185 [Novosphingobium sp.]|nr:hypothetical protein [Novosphingobium sp.]
MIDLKPGQQHRTGKASAAPADDQHRCFDLAGLGSGFGHLLSSLCLF